MGAAESGKDADDARPRFSRDRKLAAGALALAGALLVALIVVASTKPGTKTVDRIVTQTNTQYVTQTPPLRWEVGACVANNATGGFDLVTCSGQYYGVVVSTTTNSANCPYFQNDSSGDTRAVWASSTGDANYYCIVPANPYAS